MIGIDTNILLRIFEEGDDPKQSAAARRLVRDGDPIFVNPIVLAEFVWVLQSVFKFPRAIVHERVANILQASEFTVAFAEATNNALEQYATGPAEFTDYLIGELNRTFGCDATMTFDKEALNSPAFRHLKS